jgi:hypothetical protein
MDAHGCSHQISITDAQGRTDEMPPYWQILLTEIHSLMTYSKECFSERVRSSSKVSGMYSRFLVQVSARTQPFWLVYFVIFFSTSQQMLGYYPKLCQISMECFARRVTISITHYFASRKQITEKGCKQFPIKCKSHKIATNQSSRVTVDGFWIGIQIYLTLKDRSYN